MQAAVWPLSVVLKWHLTLFTVAMRNAGLDLILTFLFRFGLNGYCGGNLVSWGNDVTGERRCDWFIRQTQRWQQFSKWSVFPKSKSSWQRLYIRSCLCHETCNTNVLFIIGRLLKDQYTDIGLAQELSPTIWMDSALSPDREEFVEARASVALSTEDGGQNTIRGSLASKL